MHFRTLGRTGLRASVMGLGCGGFSRLGQSTGNSEAQSVQIVQRAMELGINFIDTAEGYGTEPIVGRALRGRERDSFILSTKKGIRQEGRLIHPAELSAGLEQSLSRLGLEYVDIYHLHGVKADEYDHCRDTLLPAMQRLREQGKLRFIGITEAFASDTTHRALNRVIGDDGWDVIMVGFNLLNQSARKRILAAAIEKNIGVLGMFAVRSALAQPQKLRTLLAQLVSEGKLDASLLQSDGPLDFLIGPDRDPDHRQDQDTARARSITDAAYRFCRDEPGMHVVLSGTGNLQHLEENLRSLLAPPLPESDRRRLIELFDGIDSVSGQ